MKGLWNGIGIAGLTLFLTIPASQAAIVKLDLAKTPAPDLGPDIRYTGSVLATPDDGNGVTLGLQDTAIVFGDFLSPITFPATTGSYSLHNLITNGPATIVGGNIVFQPMKNGDFQIYDSPANLNALLLDVDLTPSATLLTGSLTSSTGGLITVTNAKAVGGILLAYVNPNSISFSISFSNILSSGGTIGHLVLDGNNILQSFQASATKEIGAEPTPLGSPEPSSAVLLALGSLCGAIIRRRR